MRRLLVLFILLLVAFPVLAQNAQPNWNHFTIPQGGFCYLTEIPTSQTQVKIHAVTLGNAPKLGKMRADMWQTMTFGQDGAVTVSDGQFIFTFFDQATNGIPPVLFGNYQGTGPALSPFGAADVTVDIAITGGLGRFIDATGYGKVSGSAMMRPQNPENPTDASFDWFTPVAPFNKTNDFADFTGIFGGHLPGVLTPACAFMGTAELWLNKK